MDNANAAAAHLNKLQLNILRNDPTVEYVEVDPKRYLIDSVDNGPVELLAQSTPCGITMVQANQVSDAQTNNIKVCITDTGYEGNHEDLRSYTDSGITGDNNVMRQIGVHLPFTLVVTVPMSAVRYMKPNGGHKVKTHQQVLIHGMCGASLLNVSKV
jgi:subtilisin family serine protease